MLSPHDKLCSGKIVYQNIKSVVFFTEKHSNPPERTQATTIWQNANTWFCFYWQQKHTMWFTCTKSILQDTQYRFSLGLYTCLIIY